MAHPIPPRRKASMAANAFTLVELLVVIGIIAVLIGVLLPALSAARRSAQQVKCAAALQEIGMGFQLYANDQRQWFPVAKLDPSAMNPVPPNGGYSIGDDTFTTGAPAYWTNFIAPYVSANKIGNAANRALNSGNDMNQAQHTVIWGCPSWDRYQNFTTAVQTGYGMNHTPWYDPDNPSAGDAPASALAEITAGAQGRFYKQVEWTHSSDRALVTDSIFWIDECFAAPVSSHPAISPGGQPAAGNAITFTPGVTDQTLVDIYRHGKKPSTTGTDVNTRYEPDGGKISYNVLFCDFHVGEFSEASTAYRSYRMRYPG